jgi:prefoldin subunit 5
LKLIDGFVKFNSDTELQERELITECRSLTLQIEASRREIDELEQTQNSLPALKDELSSVIQAEENVSKTSDLLKQKTDSLSKQTISISSTSGILEQVSRIKNSVAVWSHEVKKGIDSAPLDSSNFDGSSKLLLSPVIDKIENIKTNLTNELNEVLKVYSELSQYSIASTQAKYKWRIRLAN